MSDPGFEALAQLDYYPYERYRGALAYRSPYSGATPPHIGDITLHEEVDYVTPYEQAQAVEQ